MWAAHFVGVFAAKPAADEQHRGDDGGCAQIDIAVLRVLVNRADSQRRQQANQTCARRFVLRKTQDVNQRGNDDKSAADAKKTRRDTGNESNE